MSLGQITRMQDGGVPYDPSADVQYSRAALDAGKYDAPGANYLGKEPGPPVATTPPPTIPVSTGRSASPASDADAAALDRSLVRDAGMRPSAPPVFRTGYMREVTPPAGRSSGGMPTPGEVDAYTRQAAEKLGIDPEVASRFVRQESSFGQNNYGDYVNGRPTSFGPLQLHYTGQGAMGDQFTHDTGLHASDLSTWKQQIDYGLSKAAKGGWGPWLNTMNKLGYEQFSGIGGKGGGEGEKPSAYASEAQATTPSGGGQYVMPGGGDGQQQGQPPRRDMSGFWNSLIAAGGAMMAGTSPYAAVNIGRGLQAGAEFMQKQSGLDREWMLADAQAQNARSETALHDAQTRKLNIETEMFKNFFSESDSPGDGAGGGAPAAAPPATAASRQPPRAGGSSGAPSIAPPGGAPISAPGTAGKGAGATPAAAAPGGGEVAQGAGAAPEDAQIAALQAQADQLRAQADRLTKKATLGAAVLGQGGGRAIQAQAQSYYTQANQIEQQILKLRTEPGLEGAKEGRKLASEQRATENENVADRTDDLRTEVQTLEAIRTLMRTVPTGWGAEHFADAQNVMRTLGFNVSDPSQLYEMVKYATRGMWESLKEQKGAVRNKEIDQASKMNFDIDKPGAANAEILAAQLGLARSELQYSTEYRNWDKTTDPTMSPTGFKTDWYTSHPLDKAVAAERKEIAYPGQAIPSKEKMVDGQVYMTKRGVGRWNAGAGQFDPVQ